MSERCGDVIDKGLHLLNEGGRIELSHRLELDLLVLEPFGRIDDDSKPQGRFDLHIEVTEFEGWFALGPETLLDRPGRAHRATVGSEKKPVLPL